jgi:hypothetical protein
MSSVVLSSLRTPAASKKAAPNPLVRDQMETVPNITHVFTADQHLYLQYEVYDAARGKNPASSPAGPVASGLSRQSSPAPKPKDSVRVLTSIEFLQGGVKVYESKPVVTNEVAAPERKAVVLQMDVPLQLLKPGLYVCQVNIIDDVSGTFAFPRFPILIREALQPRPPKLASRGGWRRKVAATPLSTIPVVAHPSAQTTGWSVFCCRVMPPPGNNART